MKKGYEAWVEWVNGRGGINVEGKPQQVEMIYYHDKSDATTGAKLTEKLITEDKVNLILGPYSGGITAATSAIGEKYGYVTIGPLATADFIYERGFKYVFSVFPPGSLDLVAVAEMAVKNNPKPKTFAVVTLDSTFTLPVLEGLKKRSLALGFQEVYYGKFPVNTNDFSGISLRSNRGNRTYSTSGDFSRMQSHFIDRRKVNVNAKLYTTTGTAGHPDWLTVMKKDGDLPTPKNRGIKT